MKDEILYEQTKKTFDSYLEKHKMRKTPERYALLQLIVDSEGHFDVEYLLNKLKSTYRISVATAYNTLLLFLDCGLIIKHPFGAQHATYAKNLDKNTHFHLVCTQCKSVKEFTDHKLTKMIQAKTFAKFKQNYSALYLYGTCSKCFPKKQKKNPKPAAGHAH